MYALKVVGFRFDLFGHLVIARLERLRSKCVILSIFGVYVFVAGYVLCYRSGWQGPCICCGVTCGW